jgi:hypothetical protein
MVRNPGVQKEKVDDAGTEVGDGADAIEGGRILALCNCSYKVEFQIMPLRTSMVLQLAEKEATICVDTIICRFLNYS